MEVDVVIVNWNTKDYLRSCLSSLENKNQTKLHIYVIDNASQDGSEEMVGELFPEVNFIQSGGNIGFGRASNLGVKAGRSPIVLFLNPDTVVRSGAIDQMATSMTNNDRIGALGCRMVYPNGTIQELGLQWFPSPITELVNLVAVSDKTPKILKYRLPYKNPNESGYVKKLYGGCLMVRKEVLHKVGSFDERFFMYCEDVDLCRRISDGGFELYYLYDAEVVHYVGGATEKEESQFSTLMKCQSISQLMDKYYGPKGRKIYRIFVFIGAQWRIVLLAFLGCWGKLTNTNKRIRTIGPFRKYLTMIKWSLGLQRAVVKP
jgi:GT2 family glycosyltransferase